MIMMYGFAPLWNRKIADATPHVQFFLSHLLVGTAVPAPAMPGSLTFLLARLDVVSGPLPKSADRSLFVRGGMDRAIILCASSAPVLLPESAFRLAPSR